MTPSVRQQNILDTWETTNSNILIGAVAGSGKTSTLMMILEKCEYRTLFIAFNKSVQEEIQNEIDERGLKQGKAMTLHSLGLSAIRGTRRRFKINNNKNWDLVKKLQRENRRLFSEIPYSDRRVINFLLMEMNNISRMHLTDNIQEIKIHMESMDKSFQNIRNLEILWGAFIELREASYEEDILEIDFQDMIYLPIVLDLEIPVHPYYLLIDECQDLNLSQHKLIDILINQGAIRKWIAVGDRNQAIYGFAGASSNSFDLFLEKPGEVVELPLDICYRCSKQIVDAANKVYDVMEYGNQSEGIVAMSNSIEDIKPNSMVICRNTLPLFELYFKLLGMDKACYINGNEVMNYLIKFLRPYSKDSVYSAKIEMMDKLRDLERDTSEDNFLNIYIFKENFKNFTSVANNMCEPTDSIEYLIEKLKSLFENRENAIMLCTIHKSKGLESDIVYILNEHLIPSKFAKSDEQLKQETNLKYVARTRAKKEMYFLNLDLNTPTLLEELHGEELE